MALALTAMLVLNHDFTGAGNYHQLALAIGHITHGRVKADIAAGLGFHAGGNGGTRSSTADVEGTHSQLRAGFADRLCRNHTYSFAVVDQAATAQVATIALGANTETGFAGQGGAHFDLVHPKSF